MSQTHNSNGNLLWRERIISQENWAEWQYEHFPNVLSEKIILHQFAMIMVIVSGHIFINWALFPFHYSKCNRFTKCPVMGKVCVWIHKHQLLIRDPSFKQTITKKKKVNQSTSSHFKALLFNNCVYINPLSAKVSKLRQDVRLHEIDCSF